MCPNTKQIYLVVIFLFSLIGCKKDEPTAVEQKKELYITPFEVGNSWHYTTYYTQKDSNIFTFWSTILNVTKDTVINSERWFLLNDSIAILTNRKDGLYQLAKDSNSQYTSTLVIPFPAQNGSEYQLSSGTLKVVQIDTSISIDDGVHSCYAYAVKYKNQTEFLNKWYYSPGIGSIREETYSYDSTGKLYTSIIKVLKHYTIN